MITLYKELKIYTSLEISNSRLQNVMKISKNVMEYDNSVSSRPVYIEKVTNT